jgi:hypothetical protein
VTTEGRQELLSALPNAKVQIDEGAKPGEQVREAPARQEPALARREAEQARRTRLRTAESFGVISLSSFLLRAVYMLGVLAAIAASLLLPVLPFLIRVNAFGRTRGFLQFLVDYSDQLTRYMLYAFRAAFIAAGLLLVSYLLYVVLLYLFARLIAVIRAGV